MVRLTVVAWAIPPPLAVTAIGYTPAAVVDATVNVTIDKPEPGAAIDAGLNSAVVPEGSPEAVSEIAELKLPAALVVTVAVPFAPRATEIAVRKAEIVKSGGAGTVRVTVEVCVMPPPVAVTVIG
jgi:hypothetical protein